MLQQSIRKEHPTNMKRELSDHLDTRASNPIHVNNLRSLFGIEKNVNEAEVPEIAEDELDRAPSIKSQKSMEYIEEQIGDKAEGSIQHQEDPRNLTQLTIKSTFSNNLFHLQKKET
jgi:hypothetical protein